MCINNQRLLIYIKFGIFLNICKYIHFTLYIPHIYVYRYFLTLKICVERIESYKIMKICEVLPVGVNQYDHLHNIWRLLVNIFENYPEHCETFWVATFLVNVKNTTDLIWNKCILFIRNMNVKPTLKIVHSEHLLVWHTLRLHQKTCKFMAYAQAGKG